MYLRDQQLTDMTLCGESVDSQQHSPKNPFLNALNAVVFQRVKQMKVCSALKLVFMYLRDQQLTGTALCGRSIGSQQHVLKLEVLNGMKC